MNDATAVTAVTVSDDLRAAREAVEIERAREELRQIRLREKLDHHYRAQIRESVYYGYSGNGFGDFVDPLDAFRDSDLRVTPLGTASRHDRQDGYNRPFVWHEIDLDLMRAQSRWIATKNLLGVGAVECLADYTVRTGFEYQARPRQGMHKDAAARALAAQVQAVVDEHCSFNLIERQGEQYAWADREWECVSQSVIDGECILRVFDQRDGGLCLVRPVQPELIRQPPGTSPLYSFGHLNPHGDVERVEEMAVWYEPTEYEPVSMGELAYLKLNTPSNVKRGLSDFYAGAELFDDTRKMLRNMVVTGGVQAAIAWIEQFDEATASALQAHVNAARDQNRPQYPRPFTGRDVSYQKIEPGSIPKVGGGRTYVPQPAAVNAASHYTTIQAGMRALAARWKMPEHTFSGDASNSNYASILAAGAPFVVRTECRQAVYGRFFVLVMWKGPIACAARAGRFRVGGHRYTYEEVSRLVDVIATPPQVAISDPQKESEIDHKDLTAGVMSIQTRRARRGLDDETEDKNLKEHPLTRVEGRATDLDSQGNPVRTGADGLPDEGPAKPDGEGSVAGASVGGLQAILQLQTSVYKGEVPREAAIANAEVVFKFTKEEAARLFPQVPPQKTADDGGQGGAMPGGMPGGMPAAPPPALGEAFAPDADHLREAEWLDANVSEAGTPRKEGEVWQGPSGRYFTLKNGRTVPARAPGGAQGKAEGKEKPAAKSAGAVATGHPGIDAAVAAAPDAPGKVKALYGASQDFVDLSVAGDGGDGGAKAAMESVLAGMSGAELLAAADQIGLVGVKKAGDARAAILDRFMSLVAANLRVAISGDQSGPGGMAAARQRVIDKAKARIAAAKASAPAPAAKPAAREKPRKLTVDEAHAAIKGMSGPATAGHVDALAKTLGGLTVKQLGELKQRLGLKASGAKAELARKLAEQALAGAKPAAPGETPTPAAPKAAPAAPAAEDHPLAGLKGTHGIDLTHLSPDQVEAVRQALGGRPAPKRGPKPKAEAPAHVAAAADGVKALGAAWGETLARATRDGRAVDVGAAMDQARADLAKLGLEGMGAADLAAVAKRLGANVTGRGRAGSIEAIHRVVLEPIAEYVGTEGG